MSERGVFAVDRGVWDHPIFAPEPYTEREAWMWMCGNAAWKDTKVRVGRTWISVARGQLAYATRFLAQKWRWSDARVRRFLSRLRFDAMVSLSPTREATIITICNYDKYAFGRRADVVESDAQERHEMTRPRRKEEELKNSKKEEKNIGAVADATRPNAGKVFDEQFWPSYPKRDGSNPRKPARIAFLTAVKSGHDPSSIVAGLKGYGVALAKSNQVGTKYVAQAVTWLHQARWEDYPVESPETTGPPQPPDPSMPSHDELKRKYEQSHDSGSTGAPAEGNGLRSESASLRRGPESGIENEIGPSNHPGKHAGMASMAQILSRSPGLRALGNGAGEEGRCEGDDGPSSMARVV